MEDSVYAEVFASILHLEEGLQYSDRNPRPKRWQTLPSLPIFPPGEMGNVTIGRASLEGLSFSPTAADIIRVLAPTYIKLVHRVSLSLICLS